MSTPPRFCSDYGKRVAKCQKCKMQLEKGSLRLGKIQPNFFIKPKDDKPPPDMKQYFHIHCLFEMLFKARPSTKVIDTTDEIEGFDDLTSEDQDAVSKLVDELAEKRSRDGGEEKPKKTPKKAADKEKGDKERAKKDTSAAEKDKPRKRKNEETDEKAKRSKKEETDEIDESSIFNMFSRFTKVCEVISSISSQQEKSAVITALLNKKGFDGDLVSWLNFLIRENDSREFKVSNETLIQHFSKILSVDESELKAEFKKSKDVSLAIRESIEKVKKNEKSDWSIQKIDRFLAKLENLEDENDIATHFKVATKKLSPIEVQYLIRLVLKDLKINITNDSILRGVHKKAAEAFENDVSIEDIVKKYKNGSFDKKEKEKEKSSKKSSHHHSRGRKDSESGDSEDDEMSESEESYVSDDEDDSDGEEMSESESSEEISSSSESEEDDEEANYKENKVKMPKGTRSRPAGNAEKKEKMEECPPDMEECRYGANCYRKNKQHKEDFWHPTK